LKTGKRFYDDWEIEIVKINVSGAEFEKRLCALMQALLEIDEILQSREIAVQSEIARYQEAA
jgi:hypothetical protein